MLVPVVRIGEMRVAVDQRLVAVGMTVARPRWNGRHMHMIVMNVLAMHMLVRVFNGLVHVAVFVPLRQMQRHSDGHQRAGSEQCSRHGLAQ